MSVSDAKRLKEFELENARLKRLLAESMLENEVTKEALRKSGERTCTALAGAPHDGLWTQRTPLTARHRLSASAYRYRPAEDRNGALKDKMIALAQRHRRYGAGMIYLKLRQAGEIVNHKLN